MEFGTTGRCTGKSLRLDQTKRNLTCRDLEISFAVIRLEVSGLKKTGFMCLLDLLEEGGRRSGMI